VRKYLDMLELLEQFMDEQNADERWVTVKEVRERFALTQYQANTISAFLRRLEFEAFRGFPFVVLRIERIERTTLSDPLKCGTWSNERAAELRTSDKNNYRVHPIPTVPESEFTRK